MKKSLICLSITSLFVASGLASAADLTAGNGSGEVVIGNQNGGVTLTPDYLEATKDISAGGTISATGALSGASLDVGTGAIKGGAITGTSVNAGTGAITTTGAINGGAITGTSVNAGAGAITKQALSMAVLLQVQHLKQQAL